MNMRRTIIQTLFVMLLAMSWQQAWAFSLLGPSLGPDATWQTPSLGYNLGGFDVGAPKNIGQGYRRNSPYIYYAYDQSFLTFFGSNGVSAVDSAFGIMNALTNADNMNLSQFPLNSQISFDARAFQLTDLKSMTLGELVEQMGLAPSVRYDWTLHDRYLPPGATCSTNPAANGEEYLVAQRNYDPVSQVYSPYVNGTLYSFDLLESCGTAGFPPNLISGLTVDALSEPIAVDADSQTYTPVSEALDVWADAFRNFQNITPDLLYGFFGGLADGSYYTGLTYDDAGGVRYLLSTNNLNFETPVPGSQLEVTNSQLQLLQTSDLGALLQFAQTNPPAAVQAAFPGIEIDSFYTYYTVVSNPIVVSYFTNYVGGNFQATPFLFIATNGYTYTAQTNYVYNFGNVVIVDYHSNTVAKLVTVSLYRPNGANYQAPPLTNVTSQTIVLTNVPSGDYYLIPPGSCGFGFYKTILSNAFAGAVTNSITTATNTFTYFNAPAGFVGSQSIVTFFTNNWYEVYGCTLQTPGAALYQGVGKVNFVKADYDSTIGQFYQPITNNFTMVTVTNSKPVLQHFQRIVTQPDILLDAEDWDSPNVAQIGPGFPPFARNVTYTQDPQVPGAVPSSGPGTITDYPVTISYNDAGNVFYVFGTEVNQTNEFVSEFPIFLWGSFDNSTNAPTIYPDGTSIQNLENEILIRITPTILPDATNGVPYSQTFTTTGGSFTPPYTWSMGLDLTTQKTSVLPLGLNLSPGGTISGTPTNNPVGTYDFVIQMMDYNGRNVTWNYSLNIDP